MMFLGVRYDWVRCHTGKSVTEVEIFWLLEEATKYFDMLSYCLYIVLHYDRIPSSRNYAAAGAGIATVAGGSAVRAAANW